jgi:hypothetical protein
MAVIELPSVTGAFSNSGDLELRGDPGGLRKIAQLMTGSVASRTRVQLGKPLTEPKPYDGYLASLDIEILKENGRGIQITRKGDVLAISGIANMMGILADNFRLLSERLEQSGETEEHIHLEYHPDHYYLAESSEPVVIVATKNHAEKG